MILPFPTLQGDVVLFERRQKEIVGLRLRHFGPYSP